MKNKLLLLAISILLIGISATSFGQVLQVYDSTGGLANGAEITLIGHPQMSGEIVSVFFIKNLVTDKDSIEVNCARTNLTIIDSTENYFCYGACYPPFVDTGSVTRYIQKGRWDSTFTAHYSFELPAGIFHKGTSRVQYTFYEMNNLANAVSVIVNYAYGTEGLDENSLSNVLSRPYPNPANDYASFDYDLPGTVNTAFLCIKNILGKEVQRIALDQASGKAIVNTSVLPAGLYLYSLILDNSVTPARKLVVTH
jgi:hypothetical protein